MYPAFLALLVTMVYERKAKAPEVEIVRTSKLICSALILSDLVHHFIFMWLLIGDPEFG